LAHAICSPFGGIPRNWKPSVNTFGKIFATSVPPSGGSLEIGNLRPCRKGILQEVLGSPFGGIPRNWKRPMREILYQAVG